ncbi:hypothetical protein GGR54DRAFT_408153 [Hypoxylon sp. NC1633]|nr:hypothetical protein GGR54DRAFT_408153 [Hypoxylon sp. NC1633]
MGSYKPWVERAEIVTTCPGPHASPSAVRHWFQSYLIYRGLDPVASDKFFWRGPELHRVKASDLHEAFKTHCSLLDWEADVLASDVCSILQRSALPPNRTYFQNYVEFLLEPGYYPKLMFDNRYPQFAVYVVGILAWVSFIAIHLVAAIVLWSALGVMMTL